MLTALLISRVRIPESRLRVAFAGYIGLMLAYGGVNFVQDGWNEQIVKRGWTSEGIPSALLPGARPIWAVVLGLAILAAWVFLREERRTSYSDP